MVMSPPSPNTVGVAHWWSPHSYSLQISVSPRHLQARRWRSRPLRDLFSSTSFILVIEMTFFIFYLLCKFAPACQHTCLHHSFCTLIF